MTMYLEKTSQCSAGGEAFGARFGHFGACQLLLKFASGKPWERALLGQILARSLLEPDFGNVGLAS